MHSDGGVNIQELDSARSLTKQLVRGTGMGGGIGSVLYNEDASASNREFFCYTAIGSVVAMTDSTGTVTSTTSYEAFGKEVASTGSTSENRKFCTKERDASIGLDNFGFRMYDPELGRFTTRDPSGYPDGANNFLYCLNNPINNIDPLGLKTEEDEDEKVKKQVERLKIVTRDGMRVGPYIKKHIDKNMDVNFAMLYNEEKGKFYRYNPLMKNGEQERGGSKNERVYDMNNPIEATAEDYEMMALEQYAGRFGEGGHAMDRFLAEDLFDTARISMKAGKGLYAEHHGGSQAVEALKSGLWEGVKHAAFAFALKLGKKAGGKLMRKTSFKEAKMDAKIPRSQQPKSIKKVPLTDRNGKVLLGKNGKPIMTREYTYVNTKGKTIIIQEHSVGHPGHVDPHFNVRPGNKPRTGKVKGTKKHYNIKQKGN